MLREVVESPSLENFRAWTRSCAICSRYDKYCSAMQQNVELSVVSELSQVLQTVAPYLSASNACQKRLLHFHEHSEKHPNICMEKTIFAYVSFTLPKA
ncbi:hypothetical protein DUI87_25346 [Hirundo rustica rustica]|uniref:Uncharacterized protein n=1 Tax=Hirundo rustica rustica TaxID=333673 RepID=A0A3M0JAG4_HIRRU|nr:hypothetical protein DUI87_25346 [Hirundo rustica rustica]